jgi:small subunit ribosomal protein S9
LKCPAPEWLPEQQWLVRATKAPMANFSGGTLPRRDLWLVLLLAWRGSCSHVIQRQGPIWGLWGRFYDTGNSAASRIGASHIHAPSPARTLMNAMESLATNFRRLRCQRQLSPAQLLRGAQSAASLQHGVRRLSTEASSSESSPPPNSAIAIPSVPGRDAAAMPFQGVKYARMVPGTPSYFSREPQFNDMLVRFTKILTKYYHLPTVLPADAPLKPWLKLDGIRAQFGEHIKASHFAKALQLAKRLNQIEASVRPAEVEAVLADITRDTDVLANRPKPLTIDKYGRAVGVGKRKESTARAFVVEGNGEILINGKPLSEAFGRVHDRESAVWALTSTERLDKYNVWALVEGGGTTGQAEAMAMAVAKGLVAHEPALKTTLRKGKDSSSRQKL